MIDQVPMLLSGFALDFKGVTSGWMFPPTGDRDRLLEVQRRIAGLVELEDRFDEIRCIGGVDQAFPNDQIVSGAVALDYSDMTVLERVYSLESVDFPYVPGLLSFREGPSIVHAVEKLERRPDVLMVDGAGYNHPRHAGLATHVGVALDIPTVGVAKNVLVGEAREPTRVGEANELVYEDEVIGYLFLSKERTNPIVVAPGHGVSLESSLEIVRHCLRGYKLPEPTRLADKYVGDIRRDIVG